IVADSAAAGPGRATDVAVATAPEAVASLPGAREPSWRVSAGGLDPVAAARGVRSPRGGGWGLLVALPRERGPPGGGGHPRPAPRAAGIALLVSIALGWWLSSRVSRPLRRIADDLVHVARFEVSDAAPPATHIREIAIVGDAAARMKASVRSFRRFVPQELV